MFTSASCSETSSKARAKHGLHPKMLHRFAIPNENNKQNEKSTTGSEPQPRCTRDQVQRPRSVKPPSSSHRLSCFQFFVFFCLDTPSCFPLVVRDEKGPPSFFLVSKTVFRQFQSEWSQRSRHPCSTKDFLSTSTQNSNKKTIERGKTNEACSRPTKQPFASPALLNFRWWREFVAINSGRRVTPAREK